MSEPRLPRADELDDLQRLLAVCFGFEPAPEGERRSRSRAIPRDARIIAVDGKPVSHIRVVYNTLSLLGTRVKVASFGGVCTHPDYRERGIATTLLHFCMDEITRAGAKLLIISGMRGLYRRNHAVPAGATWRVELTPKDFEPTSLTARRATPEDALAFASLHQAEPVRFERSAEVYTHAVSGRHHRGVWFIEHAGQPVAYAIMSHIWGLSEEEPVRALSEYGGARSAILDGLPALFAAAGLSKMPFAFPAHDREMTYLLRGRGLELHQDTIPSHTIRLLDLPGLMRILRPHVQARLTRADARKLTIEQSGDTCRFAFGDEATSLDLTRAGSVVLGHEAPHIGGKLGEILSAIFPIPLPLPGLNYV